MTVSTSRLEAVARQFRADSILMSSWAGSGHPTSAMSAAELIAVLAANHLRYDFDRPDHPNNDRLIFSKGHASTLLYALYRAAGVLPEDELRSYRKRGSRLEGHPTPVLPWVEVATGSLGQGLPIGVGMALAGRHLSKLPYRVWVLCGDSEMAEGSIWEAFDKAGHYRLDNLIAILDMNRLGQRGPTQHEWNAAAYAERAAAFGWHAVHVDGHDLGAIDEAYRTASEQSSPTLIIAKTLKGKGVSFIEDRNGWHGKALSDDDLERALAELGEPSESVTIEVARPKGAESAAGVQVQPLELPRYAQGDEVPTRDAFGAALAAVGRARSDVVAIDAEVGDSTRSMKFKDAAPERFFQMWISEQQMIAAAVGMSVLGYRPFAATFAAFMTRAYDFIRMAAVSRATLRLSGSHAGVSIGQDGPSQMGLEDLAMMRAVHGSTVLYPCDAPQTAQLVAAMAEQEGISYLRTTRGATPVIYGEGESFRIGGSKTLLRSDDDAVTVIAAGITVHQALKAGHELLSKGIGVRLIDAYSIKPIDVDSIREAVSGTSGKVVIVEDHFPEGGLGEAVLAALHAHSEHAAPRLQVRHLAVRSMPGSASTQEQLDAAGIGSDHIMGAVRELAGV